MSVYLLIYVLYLKELNFNFLSNINNNNNIFLGTTTERPWFKGRIISWWEICRSSNLLGLNKIIKIVNPKPFLLTLYF